MTKPLRLLIVEDSEDDALLLVRELRRGGYQPVYERVESAEALQEALGLREWDVMISDYVMPRFSGLDALSALQKSGLDLPFIIVSGNIGEDIAVSAMKAGAHDYIIKGSLARLAPAVERELREAEVRRAHKRAEEGRSLLATAMESTADAVVITDTRGFIQYVNAAFEQLTGYAKSEAVGVALHILDSGKHDEEFYEELREAIQRNGVWTGRLFNKKKDGTLYLEDCSYSPVKDETGNIINYISVKRDVSDKARLESIAESVNMMNNIGYIFSGVRHEIGNPVNTINMTLSLLKDKLGKIDQPAIEKYLDRALHEVSRIEYLLRTLKNFNMFEKPDLQTVPVQAFLEKFLVLVGEDFKAKGIEIVTAVDRDAEFFHADPRALQQVMINLLTNAADALNGRQNPKVTIGLSKLDGKIQIRMEDNGCGIPEEKLKDLFKPFYTSKVHGTGLGLVIVKKVLAKMYGTIEITSHKDVGTVVDISLPDSEKGTAVA
jgi:PAS domain S-box-containing protein